MAEVDETPEALLSRALRAEERLLDPSLDEPARTDLQRERDLSLDEYLIVTSDRSVVVFYRERRLLGAFEARDPADVERLLVDRRASGPTSAQLFEHGVATRIFTATPTGWTEI